MITMSDQRYLQGLVADADCDLSGGMREGARLILIHLPTGEEYPVEYKILEKWANMSAHRAHKAILDYMEERDRS